MKAVISHKPTVGCDPNVSSAGKASVVLLRSVLCLGHPITSWAASSLSIFQFSESMACHWDADLCMCHSGKSPGVHKLLCWVAFPGFFLSMIPPEISACLGFPFLALRQKAGFLVIWVCLTLLMIACVSSQVTGGHREKKTTGICPPLGTTSPLIGGGWFGTRVLGTCSLCCHYCHCCHCCHGIVWLLEHDRTVNKGKWWISPLLLMSGISFPLFEPELQGFPWSTLFPSLGAHFWAAGCLEPDQKCWRG